MNYPIIEPEDITENILYCSKHKEYFSNNCSECMLDANDPDTISKAKTDTRSELAKAVREMSPINAVGFQQAVLKLLEGK